MKIVKIQPARISLIKKINSKRKVAYVTEKVLETTVPQKLTSRKVPNYIGIDEDYVNWKSTTQYYIDFYPEDKEKMAKMSQEERIAYKKELLKSGQHKIIEGTRPIEESSIEEELLKILSSI